MRSALILILIISSAILFFWKDTISNINSRLIGWNDEAFVIWLLQNNIKHFTKLDFTHLYETNAMYPFKYSLSFTEHVYPQSIEALIISIFTKNIIEQYNILLITNHLLIFLTSFLFFRYLLKNLFTSAVSSFYITFSPYFFDQIGHFQMVSFWPLFLSLYFILKFSDSKKKKYLILSGLLGGIQVLSSIYLGIMTLYIVFVLFLTQTFYQRRRLWFNAKVFLTFVSITLIISSISLWGYYLMNKTYKPQRDYREYVVYSAHLSDYLFPPGNQNSLLYSTPIFLKIKSLDRHYIGEKAAFLGLIPLLFAFYHLIPNLKFDAKKYSSGQKNQNIPELINSPKINFIWKINSLSLFAISLVATGIIFSFGPRLFVNGEYTSLPLPYDLILKVFPPIGIMRALARWALVADLGIAILLGLGYSKLEEKIMSKQYHRYILFVIAFFFLLMEFWSKPFPVQAKDWNDNSYKFLNSQICANSQNVLLEYPFTYRNTDGDLIKDLQYKTVTLLNSTQHNCRILSGFTAYEPTKYLDFKQEFDNGFDSKDIQLIKNLHISYIKFNKFAISDEEYQKIKADKILDQFTKVYDDSKISIFKVD